MSYSDAYDPNDGVAIIGLAGRFPGARNVDEFWHNLVDGRETISLFADDELEPASPDEMEARRQPNYVRSRGILEDVELFDAEFFGITRSEAEVMDPQQRVFLETAWEALEHAGHDPRTLRGRVGVFAGMSNNYYFLQNLLARPDVTDIVGWLTTMMGNEKDYLATRVSYKLDLKRAGAQRPDRVLDVARRGVHRRCRACSTTSATWRSPAASRSRCRSGAATSTRRAGSSRPTAIAATFDERRRRHRLQQRRRGRRAEAARATRSPTATPSTPSSRASAMNNDGAAKVSFTAPSVDGQAGVIALAQALAGIDPRHDLVRRGARHGHAARRSDRDRGADPGVPRRRRDRTRLLRDRLGQEQRRPLDAAAGVAGLIKTALALHHKTLPPTPALHGAEPEARPRGHAVRRRPRSRPWQAPEGVRAARA